MAPPVPTCAPSEIVAGTTVKYIRVLSDYPVSEGWTLKAALRGENAIDASVLVSGEERTITFAADKTETLEPGRYILAEWVEGSGVYAGEQHETHRSVVEVAQGVENAQAGELQSHAEQLVKAGEARLHARLTDEQLIESYGIAGRSVTRVPIEKLDAMIRRWRWDVWRERNHGKLGPAVRGRFIA